MDDDKPITELFDLDLKDAFTRMFACADRWMLRTTKTERELAECRNELSVVKAELEALKTTVSNHRHNPVVYR